MLYQYVNLLKTNRVLGKTLTKDKTDVLAKKNRNKLFRGAVIKVKCSVNLFHIDQVTFETFAECFIIDCNVSCV